MNQKYEELKKIIGEKVKENVSLADYTSFKIGGPADLFYEAETENDLVRVLGVVREMKVPYFILGGGSNILVGDKGFRGLIIKLSNCELNTANDTVLASAGVPMVVLLDECRENSLKGLEFMAGIPGTVGGAVRGNAGAWQKSVGERVLRVKILSDSDEIKWIEHKDCSFTYRESRFKHNGEIILAVEFKMNKGKKEEIEDQIKTYHDKRLGQPKEPSAGCIFINPKPKSAGELIEECGLKGKQIGGGRISENHANFIINTGGAKASDVITLIEMSKQTVKEKFNIDLREEIVRVGEF